MVWAIVAVVALAVVAYLGFRAAGRQPVREESAEEHQDSRDRMI